MDGLPQNCSDVQASLPLYVGADLEAPAMDAVGAHLAACADCAALHERSRQARSALRELRRHQGRTASSVSLWDGIRERLLVEGLIAPREGPIAAPRAEITTVASAPRPVASSRRVWGGVAAAAALLIAVPLALHSIEEPRTELAPSPGPGTIVDAQPVSAPEPEALVSSDVASSDVAPSGEEAWALGIRPLRPAGSEDPSLFDRALSGEGQRGFGPSAPGSVQTVNRIFVPRLR